jgi:type IV pilus assembly protein PilB
LASRKRIGTLLVESGLLSPEELKTALRMQRERPGVLLGRLLIEQGVVTESDISRTLCLQLGMDFIDLDEEEIDTGLLEWFPSELAVRHTCLPVERRGRLLRLATANPLDISAIDSVRFSLDMEVEPLGAVPSQIEGYVDAFYGEEDAADTEGGGGGEEGTGKQSPEAAEASDLAQEMSIQLLSSEEDQEEEEGIYDTDDLERSKRAPIVRMVNLILEGAVKAGASDIHLEPYPDKVVVRRRVDGVLRRSMELPKWMHSALVARIKILAKMDITSHFVGQDGRIRARVAGGVKDFRVSSLPAHFGENVVIRILDRERGVMGLEDLGMEESQLPLVHEAVSQPQGIILVTGPTGSGKTSTLYSMMKHVQSDQINLITVEDPVEFEEPGLVQVSVDPKQGRTFAGVLRTILRQDPDVVMVGEIRDRETADIAVEAAMTGHLVLSSLHTNSAVGAVTRLREMGVSSYLVASSLSLVVAQRLARLICGGCREPHRPDAELADRLRRAVGADRMPSTFYRGRGCEECDGTGYRGRTAIMEVLSMNQPLRELIHEEARESRVLKVAREHGYALMIESGLAKLRRGVTSLEELLRVVQTEEIADGAADG